MVEEMLPTERLPDDVALKNVRPVVETLPANRFPVVVALRNVMPVEETVVAVMVPTTCNVDDGRVVPMPTKLFTLFAKKVPPSKISVPEVISRSDVLFT